MHYAHIATYRVRNLAPETSHIIQYIHNNYDIRPIKISKARNRCGFFKSWFPFNDI